MNKKKIYSLLRILLLLISFLSIIGWSRLNLESDFLELLPKTPERENLQEYKQVFSQFSQFSISLVYPKKSEEELLLATEYALGLLKKNPYFEGTSARFDLGTMADIRSFYDKQIPNLLDQSSFSDISAQTTSEEIFARFEEIFEEQVSVGPSNSNTYLDPLLFSHLYWKKILANASPENFRDGYLFSKTENALLLHVPLLQKNLSYEKSKECWQFLQEVSEELTKKFPGIEMVSIGGEKVASDNRDALEKDVFLTTLFAISFIFLLFYFIFQTFSIFLLMLLPSFFGLFVGIGLSNFFCGKISLLTLGCGAILIGITIDYAIHYLIHLQLSSSKDGQEVADNLFKPLSIAMSSTALAFLMPIFSEVPLYVELGYFVSFGILGSYLFVLFIFPILCQHFPQSDATPKAHLGKLIKLLDTGNANLKFRVFLIIFITIFTSLALFWTQKINFSSDLQQLSYSSPQTIQAEKRFFSLWGDQRGKMVVLVEGSSLEDTLSKNEEIHHLLRQEQEKGNIRVTNFWPSLFLSLKTMENNRRAWQKYWSPEKQEQVRKDFQRASKHFGFSFSAFEPFFTQLSQPSEPQSIQALLANPSFQNMMGSSIKEKEGKWYIQYIIQKQNKIDSLFEKLKEKDYVSLIDQIALVQATNKILAEKTIWITVFAFLVVLSLLTLYFIHPEMVLVGILPLGLSLVWIFGLMYLFSTPLNMLNVLLIVFVLGLGIDYSVFQIVSYSESIGEKKDTQAYRGAIILSGITTIICFGVLCFSSHPALYNLGSCVAIGMLVVLFQNLFFVPLLLELFIPPHRNSHPLRLLDVLGSIWSVGFFVSMIVFLAVVVFPIIGLWQIIFRKKDNFIYTRIIETINRKLLQWNLFHLCHYIDFPSRNQIQGKIVVANHSDTIDIPVFNSLPFDKVSLVKWFWKFPFIKSVLRKASFIPLSPTKEMGENNNWKEPSKKSLLEKCNVFFFPEGTRNHNLSTKRFRLGAFELARETNASILPLCFFNTRWTLPRARLVGRMNRHMYVKALPLVTPDNFDYGLGAKALAKHVSQIIDETYEEMSQKYTSLAQKIQIACDSYRHISPPLDAYLFFKLKTDKNYKQLPFLLPREGKILDLGCGEGFLSNLMVYLAEKREVLGVDYDLSKISLAKRSLIGPLQKKITFIHGNIINEIKITENQFSGVLCSDILHYFSEKEQRQVLEKAWKAMKKEATIVIRQDVKNVSSKNRRAFLEWWGKFLGKNLFLRKPNYPGEKELYSLLEEMNFRDIQLHPMSLYPSQLILVAKK